MPRITILAFVLAAAAPVGGAEGFRLDVEESSSRRPPDAATQARLARWRSRTGRMEHDLRRQQAALGMGGMVGVSRSLGVTVGVGVDGSGPHLVSGVVRSGLPGLSGRLDMVRWPWEDTGRPEPLSVEEQVAVLLGERLAPSSDD